MVQFSASAYSPRLVLWIARDPVMSHALGVFTATFLYAIAALTGLDRNGSGHVPIISFWLFMTLIHTCELNGVNPFDYLAELLRHSADLSVHPSEWMPWNYPRRWHDSQGRQRRSMLVGCNGRKGSTTAMVG
jgi:predicted membrane protein DUF2254/transposase IS66-like protein